MVYNEYNTLNNIIYLCTNKNTLTVILKFITTIYTQYKTVIGYEPADLTVHPPPPNDRGWVHFFRIGV